MIAATTVQLLELFNATELPPEFAARLVTPKSENAVTLVTHDAFCRNEPRYGITATDALFLSAAHFPMVELTPAMMRTMWKRSRVVGDMFDVMARDLVDRPRAETIRTIRVQFHSSWRTVALTVFDAVGALWMPPDNQLMGMALCDAAAEHFGEDYMTGEWNP